MDRRYQVFVSSTYDDLREERNEVMHALLELDCIPAGMELFPAADEDQWTLIKKVIDDCDYYVVIVGGRYGSLHSSGKSYTQMEYEYALSKQKPTIAFLHQEAGSIPAAKTESTDEGKQKLEEFRQLAKTKAVKYWSSPSDLGSKVSRSIVQLTKSRPAAGWVRADEAAEVAAPEILSLRQRIDELSSELRKAAQRPPEGSAELAQGNDEYRLTFDTVFVDNEGTEVWESGHWLSATWNAIFKAIAPHLMDWSNEREIQEILEERFKTAVEEVAAKDPDLAPGKWKQGITLSTATLIESDVKTILVQLRALGLITRRAAGAWMLTPLGDETMTRLIAVRKKRPTKS
jgi:hypothetical protein